MFYVPRFFSHKHICVDLFIRVCRDLNLECTLIYLKRKLSVALVCDLTGYL